MDPADHSRSNVQDVFVRRDVAVSSEGRQRHKKTVRRQLKKGPNLEKFKSPYILARPRIFYHLATNCFVCHTS